VLSGVSKTAILTIRARADEHARDDGVFDDPVAADWWSRLSWPPDLDEWYADDAQGNLAFRAHDIDLIVCEYASTRPAISVIELGCGLSTRRERLQDLASTRWVDVDLPEVAELRKKWGASGQQVGCSVLDHSWMDHVAGDPANHIFIAEGLLYYLPRAGVDALLAELERRFAGSAFIMDVIGKNDHAKLLENTARVGSPIQWCHEGDFEQVLETFGLGSIEGLEPAALNEAALTRYWDRFSKRLQVAIYWAMNAEDFRGGRSGTVIGRLKTPP